MEENENEIIKSPKGGPPAKTVFFIALVAIVSICICIVFYFLIERFSGFASGWGKLLNVLQPILLGAATAFIVNPIMNAYERRLLTAALKKAGDDEEKQEKARKRSRGLAVALSMTTFLVIVVGIIVLIIPMLISNIAKLVQTVPTQVQSLMAQLRTYMDNSQWADTISTVVVTVTNYINQWLKDTVLPQVTDYLRTVMTGVVNVLKTLLNMIIGIIVAVYILSTKETFAGQFKKLTYAIFKPGTGNILIDLARKTNEIFSGFVVGKIVDSMIIGVIAFFVLTIMRMPYSMMLAVIIGVTNIIPVFGPFIGAIPCFVLVVLNNPMQGLYFLIFIFILQQVDGNIIGPKILGDSTNLSSFWVMFAILFGGGFFGVPGMLLAVPVFAVIFFLLTRLTNWMLRRKGLPTNTELYVNADRVDVNDNTLVELSDEDEDEDEGDDNTPGKEKKKTLLCRLRRLLRRKKK